MLTQDQLDKWLVALRSGEYKQITNYLKTPDGYCCIGVLCDLVNHDAWDDPNVAGSWSSWKSGAITFEAGLPPAFLPDAVQCKLIHLNDADGKSFSEIADWIEQNAIDILQ